MRRGCLLVIVLALTTLVVVRFIVVRGSADETVSRWADELRGQLTPPGGILLYTSPTQRDSFSATVTWEFETRQTWAEYGIWARSRLAPDYQPLVSKDESTFSVCRMMAGDSQDVTMTKVAEGPPLRVRVMFHTIAD